jgi:hypothetical protein
MTKHAAFCLSSLSHKYVKTDRLWSTSVLTEGFPLLSGISPRREPATTSLEPSSTRALLSSLDQLYPFIP